MSRGFVSVIYQQPGGGYADEGRETWRECTRRSLASLRACHPREEILLVNVDALSAVETQELSPFAEVVSPALSAHWAHDTWNKVLAAQVSPFDETIVVDLDFFVVGDLLSAVEDTTEAIGVLYYPTYSRVPSRINTGLVVIRDRAALPTWLAARRPQRRCDDDEYGLDRLLCSRKIRVSMLSHLYGTDRGALWEDGPGVGGCSAWGARSVDWTVTPPVFRSGLDVVRAYHLSGARPRMAADPTIERFLGQCYDLPNRNTASYPATHGDQDPQEEARWG